MATQMRATHACRENSRIVRLLNSQSPLSTLVHIINTAEVELCPVARNTR